MPVPYPEKISTPQKLSLRERRRLLRRTWLRKSLLPVISRPFSVGAAPAIVLSPHQDDETLGCGGLIARKRQAGVPIAVAFVTDGGKYLGDVSAARRTEINALRRQEALEALETLGVPAQDVHFLDLPDGSLHSLDEAGQQTFRRALTSLFERYCPGEIYVPHRRDSHSDHEATYSLLGAALSTSPIDAVVYEYPVWMLWSRNRLFSNLRWSDLAGSLRLPINDVLERKRAAMAAYPSQLSSLPAGFVEHLLDGSEYFFRSALTPRR